MPTRIGLIAGRHEMQANDGEIITDFIFAEVEDVHDYENHIEKSLTYLTESKVTNLELYMTGLTPVAIAFVIAAKQYGKLLDLNFMNYDRDTGKYICQPALSLCE